jgi:hypothetical protein
VRIHVMEPGWNIGLKATTHHLQVLNLRQDHDPLDEKSFSVCYDILLTVNSCSWRTLSLRTFFNSIQNRRLGPVL